MQKFLHPDPLWSPLKLVYVCFFALFSPLFPKNLQLLQYVPQNVKKTIWEAKETFKRVGNALLERNGASSLATVFKKKNRVVGFFSKNSEKFKKVQKKFFRTRLKSVPEGCISCKNVPNVCQRP